MADASRSDNKDNPRDIIRQIIISVFDFPEVTFEELSSLFRNTARTPPVVVVDDVHIIYSSVQTGSFSTIKQVVNNVSFN